MIDNRENWVRELKDDNIVQVEYVPSNCNYADILSKCIVGGEFNRMVNMISNDYRKRSQVKSREEVLVQLAVSRSQEKSSQVKSRREELKI